MVVRLTVGLVLLAVVLSIYLEIGPWMAGALAVMFMMITYLDNQVKVLRHELRVARHDGELNDNNACNTSN